MIHRNNSELKAEKFVELISFIFKQSKKEKIDQLYLHKYLFYLDFISYALTQHSITGSKYKANKWGPTSTSLNLADHKLKDIVDIKIEPRSKDKEKKVYYKKHEIDTPNITLEEKTIINNYLPKLLKIDIVEISHKEEAWKKNYRDDKASDISYEDWAHTISFLKNEQEEVDDAIAQEWNKLVKQHCA